MVVDGVAAIVDRDEATHVRCCFCQDRIVYSRRDCEDQSMVELASLEEVGCGWMVARARCLQETPVVNAERNRESLGYLDHFVKAMVLLLKTKSEVV